MLGRNFNIALYRHISAVAFKTILKAKLRTFPVL